MIQEVQKFVKAQFTEHLPLNRHYHNYIHTLHVVEGAKKLCKAYQFSSEALQDTVIAAYFHDLGHVETYDGHEEVSAQLAYGFLMAANYEVDRLKRIQEAILKTKMPQNPQSLMEKILCDSDLYHLSTPDFLQQSNALRREWKEALGKEYTDKEWFEINCEFLENHSYHTDFAIYHWDKNKRLVLKQLKADHSAE